eukprot:s219_g18.t3
MAKWYDADHELNYVESLVLVTIVFLELLFDGFWHYLSQPAGKSYRYGDKHEEAFENTEAAVLIHPPQHVQLYKELVNKMGGEFMSLGFIAFMVFCSNQLGLFEYLAERLPSCGSITDGSNCVVLPYTGDWLHLIELVHVQLFVGMMLYFVLMFGVVRGSVFQIKSWEVLRLRRIATGRLSRSFSATLRQANKDKDLQDYVCLREYLVVKVLEWRQTRPTLFKQVTDTLGMVNLPDEEDSLSAEVLVEDMVRSQLEQNFAFSSYLALNVESAVRDSIELHAGTWITIIVLFTALALGCRFANLTILGTLPVVVSLAILLVLIMVVVTRFRHRSLAKVSRTWMDAAMQSRSMHRVSRQQPASAPDSTWMATCQGRGYLSWEKFLMRFLQVFLFVISYTFSRTLIEFKDWQEKFEWQAPIASSLAILFMLLLFVLPAYVPVFLELMALPPFLDKDNLSIFFAVIDEGFATRFKHEGSVMEKKRRNSARGAKGMAASMSTLGSMKSMNSMNSMVSSLLDHRTALVPRNQRAKPDPTLVAISELVSILQNCDTIEDLRSLRENLESQLPEGLELPESRGPSDLLNESF